MIKSKTMLVLLLLTAMAQGVWGWSDNGSKGTTYLIKTVTDWNTVVSYVNKGTIKNGDYVKLSNNIVFNDGVSNPSNCMPIGEDSSKPFLGTFDGDGHTISGFYLHNGKYTSYTNKGLFGYIGSGGVVKNLIINGLDISITSNAGAVASVNEGTIEDIIVSNSTIEVFNNVAGGIAANNNNSGTIQNCHVLDNVTIKCTATSSSFFGGIVGNNDNKSTINNCSNATTIAYDGTTTSGITKYGGIVGSNTNSSTIENCLYLGGDVVAGTNYGSIAGLFYGTLQNNYYTQATTGGVTNEDKPDNDGAVPALRNNSDNATALSLLKERDDFLESKSNPNEDYTDNYTMRLYGRTLYKDGYWNTLCLPFDITLEGSILKGATAKTLGSSSFGGGTLTLNFEDATTIEAGKPYIIKWTKPDPYTAYNGNNASTCSDIVNPSFTNINIKNVDAPKITDEVIFQGTFSPQTLTANDNTVLYLGANSTLYYPSADVTLNAFRAYFKLKGLTAGEPTQVRAITLNFGDEESTGIVDTEANSSKATGRRNSGNLFTLHSSLSEWYSLDGRRYADPTVLPKGVYIHNGRKVVIK